MGVACAKVLWQKELRKKSRGHNAEIEGGVVPGRSREARFLLTRGEGRNSEVNKPQGAHRLVGDTDT